MIYKRIYLFLVVASLHSFSNASSVSVNNTGQINDKLAKLEASFDGKIGVYAIDTNNNSTLAYRANERFPIQSTMKMIGAAALLKRSESNKKLLQEKIHYTKSDLIGFSHVTRHNLDSGMTLVDLAEGAVTYSDDTAINVIMKKFGGPKFATAFANEIGNASYNVTHYDGYMNSNPNSQEDTSTPKDMAISVQRLLFGNVLTKTNQQQLLTWMRNSVTSYKLIRLGAPVGFAVADKSGGDNTYGVRNDIGIMWSPACKPIVLAIYTIRNKKEEKSRDDIVAATTSIISDEFAQQNSCFNE